MWDNYIGKQLRRCNRNLLLVNLILLLLLGTYAGVKYRYLANFILGAKEISNAELMQIRDPEQRFRYFVRIDADQVFETGFQSVERKIDKYTNAVQSETVTAEYVLARVGQKLLVIKAHPGTKQLHFSGALEDISDDVRSQVIAQAINAQPELGGAFLQLMLNANDYRDEGYWTFGIGIPVLALVMWNLSKWNRRRSDASAHPVYKRLSCFGVPEQLAQQIENTMKNAPPEKIGKAYLHGEWLFSPTTFGLTMFHLPDIVWVHEKITRHYYVFIPTGKSFDVVLYDRFRFKAEIQSSKKNTEAIIARVTSQVPWVAAGYSKELEGMWNSQPAEFIAAVEKRQPTQANAAQASST